MNKYRLTITFEVEMMATNINAASSYFDGATLCGGFIAAGKQPPSGNICGSWKYSRTVDPHIISKTVERQ